MSPIAAAAARAPGTAGVYFLLDAGTELLYVGKAGSLRRRLQQHARARPRQARFALLYRRVAEVRWEEQPDEDAAAAREADLIVSLRPAFNAGSALAGQWNYLLVEPAGGELRFRLAADPGAATGGRVYGCFPHLGRGASLRPAIACSDGYPALLRLLLAASGRPEVAGWLSRSIPDALTLPVAATLRPLLHAFLSGTSHRLLDQLAAAGRRREAYLQPGLARDRAAAAGLFEYGPRALRRLRLRHGRPPGPLARPDIEQLLAADLRRAIGEFRLPPPPDPAAALLGRRARPWRQPN